MDSRGSSEQLDNAESGDAVEQAAPSGSAGNDTGSSRGTGSPSKSLSSSTSTSAENLVSADLKVDSTAPDNDKRVS